MSVAVLVASPIGFLRLAGDEDGTLTGLHFAEAGPAGPVPAPLAPAAEQLAAYFAGERRDFDLPVRLTGSSFQLQVWAALRTIPYGDTRSYGELAAAVGEPGAARAVGRANNRNPVSIVVPCHRVIGADGSLTGYGGGLPRKAWLLDHERRLVAAERGRLF